MDRRKRGRSRAMAQEHADFSRELEETWRINVRVTLKLLDHLEQEGLEATLSTRGGRTVGQQLAHMAWNHRQHLERTDRELAARVPEIGREQGHDPEALRAAFEASEEAVAEMIRVAMQEKGGRVKGFKRGIVARVGYFIAHDSHHRGHILLTLKQAGIRRPEALKTGLWEWNRI
jgi:uncharacterized damage-inducible protein DinB